MSGAEKIFVSEARTAVTIGRTVQVQGWVRTRRDSKGGFSFLEINDGSCFGNLQIFVPGELPNYESEAKKLSAGASVRVTGLVKESPAKGQATELVAAELVVLGFCDAAEYPLQPKAHSFPFLRSIAHLRPRTNTFGAVQRIRSAISMAIHDFFRSENFYWLHTPLITASDCEGAGKMFQATTLNAENPPRVPMDAKLADGSPDPRAGKVNWSEDFFGREAFLTVSGQLSAETYACALGRVYTFGPTFRAENSNTPRHLSEFWMIEPEAAFFELEDNMGLAERMLKAIFSECLDHHREDLEFFNLRINPTVIATLESLVDSEFLRVSYTEAIDILEKSGRKFEFSVAWGCDLQSEHERFLTEEHFKQPVILYDYPKDIKAFYMKLNDDDRTVRAMDVLVPRIGEIIGGSQREDRLDVLVQRMNELGLDPAAYGWYLDLRRYGSVPHSGFGLGLERIVQFVTGMENIRDVIPFPRYPGNADF